MFNVGDRVQYINNTSQRLYLELGTVVYPFGGFVGVRFDKNVKGHDLGGHCEYGHGRWVPRGNLVIVNDESEAFNPASDEDLASLLGL